MNEILFQTETSIWNLYMHWSYKHSMLIRLTIMMHILFPNYGNSKDAARPKSGVQEFWLLSLLARMRAFQWCRTSLYMHVIYRWKAQNLSFPFARGTRSCIRVRGSGVLVIVLYQGTHVNVIGRVYSLPWLANKTWLLLWSLFLSTLSYHL